MSLKLTHSNKFLCTDSMSKFQRKSKIFIDYVRNTRGATTVAPYSLRARDNATISVPLFWDELTAKIRSNTYTIKNIKRRLRKLKTDPWETFYTTHQFLPPSIVKFLPSV